jgi:ABC-type branched-subunit amino acid transport system permease subunit
MSSDRIKGLTPDDFERYKFTRTRLREEIMYRRESQWKVFTWASNLLVAIIGGVIALSGKGFSFSRLHLGLLIFAIIVLAVGACLRIRHDAKVSVFNSNAAFELDKEFGLEFDDQRYKRWHLRHIGSIIFLAAAAIVTVVGAPKINVIQSPPPSNNSFNPTPR